MPEFKLIIATKAFEEIQEAIDYYNSRQIGLGRRFFNELEKQFDAISKNPFYRSIRYDNIRLARLNKFPYAAHYEVDDDKIFVNAVLCDYKNKRH